MIGSPPRHADVDWDAAWQPYDPAARKRLARSRRRALAARRSERARYLLGLRALRGAVIADVRPCADPNGEECERVHITLADGEQLIL